MQVFPTDVDISDSSLSIHLSFREIHYIHQWYFCRLKISTLSWLDSYSKARAVKKLMNFVQL